MIKGKRELEGRDIKKELKEVFNFFKDTSMQNKKVAKSYLQIENKMMDFILYEHLDLALLIAENINYKKKSFNGIKETEYSYKVMALLGFIFITLSNDLLIIKDLLNRGFKAQACTLVRNYIESIDLAVACLFDETFFNSYKTQPVDEAHKKQIWYQTRPKKVVQILKTASAKIDEAHGEDGLVLRIRNEFYSYASLFAHSNYAAVCLSAYTTSIESPDNVIPAIGGLVNPTIRYIYKQVILYSKFALLMVYQGMIDIHKLPFMKFGKNGIEHAHLVVIVDRLFKRVVETFVDE